MLNTLQSWRWLSSFEIPEPENFPRFILGWSIIPLRELVPPVWFSLLLLLWKWGDWTGVINNSLFKSFLAVPEIQVSCPERWRCRVLWIVENCGGLSFLSRWSSKKHSQRPVQFCMVLDSEQWRVDWEGGSLQNCFRIQDRKKFSGISPICFFAKHTFSSIFQFLDSLLHDFLGRVYSSNPILHTSLFSLWAWSAHRFACCSGNRWDSSHEEQYQNFIFSLKYRLHLCLNIIQFCADHFLLGRPIELSAQAFCWDFPCLLTIAQRFDLDLCPFH